MVRHPIQQTETRTLGETVVPIMTTGRRVAYLAAVAITLGVGLAGLIALLTPAASTAGPARGS